MFCFVRPCLRLRGSRFSAGGAKVPLVNGVAGGADRFVRELCSAVDTEVRILVVHGVAGGTAHFSVQPFPAVAAEYRFFGVDGGTFFTFHFFILLHVLGYVHYITSFCALQYVFENFKFGLSEYLKKIFIFDIISPWVGLIITGLPLWRQS